MSRRPRSCTLSNFPMFMDLPRVVECRQMMRILLWTLFLILITPLAVMAAEESPRELKDVGIDPVLGTQAPLNLPVVNESGQTVPLSTFFDGHHPVALIFAYYECPMLCGLVLNAARESLQRADWLPGDQYRIVTISIDPKEGAELARDKKKAIVGAATSAKFRDAAGSGWQFLVGKDGSERRLADALGFKYKWEPEEKQWAHGAALFVLSPTGRLSRVLFGLDFPPRDLKLALLEAGEGKIGTIAEKLLLFCYHYDPKGNKYAILATRLVSLGGALTVAALLLAWAVWFCRRHRKGIACPALP